MRHMHFLDRHDSFDALDGFDRFVHWVSRDDDHAHRRDGHGPSHHDRGGERGGGRGGERGGRRGRFGREFQARFGEHFAARKFSSGQLQLLLLTLLEQAPAHGYELIRALEHRSGGFYAPSPGMVYPALTYLDETGLAAASAEGNRKLYTITDEGRAHVAANRDEAEAIVGFLARIGGRMEAVREAFTGVGDVDPAAAEDLHRARHGLKSALIRARGASPDEVRRLVRILDEATRQILAGPDHGKGEGA